jgi:prepilin-type processing-associated H-X9-DG protein
MKAISPKKSKQTSKPAVQLKDLKPKKAVRAGGTSGANVLFCDGSVRFLSSQVGH